MRERIYDTLNGEGGLAGTIYNYAMMGIIVASLVPLIFKESTPVLVWVDRICVVIFIADYLLRLFTADCKLNRGRASFALYPVTPMAIIDLLCILPAFIGVASGLRLLKVIRLIRTFRVFRTFKMFRYSKSMQALIRVIIKQKSPLIAVATLVGAYILICAMVMFNLEPDIFDTFFDAIYWATISLTTVGYGDIVPVTAVGRLINILSSLMGILVIALPSGVITAGYMAEINQEKEKSQDKPSREKTDTAQN